MRVVRMIVHEALEKKRRSRQGWPEQSQRQVTRESNSLDEDDEEKEKEKDPWEDEPGRHGHGQTRGEEERMRHAYTRGDDLDEDEEKKSDDDDDEPGKWGHGLSSSEEERVRHAYERGDLDEVSKKTAKKQVKALGGPRFKDKAETAKDWGVKDPEAFVASRMDKAHGKSWRKKGK